MIQPNASYLEFQVQKKNRMDDVYKMLKKHNIALWDVLDSCEIKGASDASIKNAKANDMNFILDEAPIKAIFTTGAKANDLYKKMCYPICGVSSIRLPSTSPANARYKLEDLCLEWEAIIKTCLQFK